MRSFALALALALAVLALACAPESVDSVTLTPVGPHASEIEAALLAADARWEAAGVAPERVVIGEGGAPVRFAPERGNTSETRVSGQRGVFAAVLWIELSTLSVGTAIHELGHALGANSLLLDDCHVHGAACDADSAERPAMCEWAGEAITERDLDLVCGVGTCAHFTPEM